MDCTRLTDYVPSKASEGWGCTFAKINAALCGPNPVPAFSTLENLLKRKEWKGATVTREIRKMTVRFSVSSYVQGQEVSYCDHTYQKTRGCLEITEDVDCHVVTTRDGRGMMVLRVVTGEALIEIRRAQRNAKLEEQRAKDEERARIDRERRAAERAEEARMLPLKNAEERRKNLQSHVYADANEVSRLEKALAHARAMLEARTKDLENATRDVERLTAELAPERAA